MSIYIGISTLVMSLLPHDVLITSDKPLIDGIETVLGPIGGKLLAALGLVSLLAVSYTHLTLPTMAVV